MTLALTTATPSPQDSSVVGLYRNTTEGFSVLLPDGWTGEELENTFPLLSIDGEEQGLAVNAQVWIFPRMDNATAESWIDAQFVQYNPGAILSSEARPHPGADSGHQSSITASLAGRLLSSSSFGRLSPAIRRCSWSGCGPNEESWPTVAPPANAFTDSFTLETPMPFGVSREDSLFQYWGEIVGIDPAKFSRWRRGHSWGNLQRTGEAGHRSQV